MNLFDLIDADSSGPVHNDTWRPEAPPDLSNFHNIFVNFETTGLRWFEDDLPISMSVYAGDRSWYLPFKHAGGGNLSEEQVYSFAQSLRNKHITNINTRFDIHNGREWGKKMGRGGLDFEKMGCTFSDVAHSAALLDDHRLHLNLDSLVRDYLREIPMQKLDESRMRSYSAGAAQARARYNVESVKRLDDVLYPQLENEDLMRVKELENKVIPIVCEMEHNGALLNEELLDEWIIETKRKYYNGIMDLYHQTGMKINPGSNIDVAKLFRHLKLPIIETTEKGNPSFTDEVLKVEKHPIIVLLRHTKKLGSLHSKLKKYKESIDSHGILRYALHQLRAARTEGEDSSETGTVVGRFTSTEIVEGFGVNIQQVLKPEKQILTFGDEFFIRNLFIPEKGKKYLSADAAQLQYRIGASMAKNPRVLAMYKEDPWISYHKMIWAELKKVKRDIPYKRTKDTNFARQFGAGLRKIALMIEEITKREYFELLNQKAGRDHPKLRKTAEFLKIYDREFPEINALLKSSSELAKSQGYVTDIIGRRMRFPDGERLYKAFNGIIIMSEASIVKTKLVELHEAREDTQFLLRAQVHDEVDGDVPDEHHAEKVREILNRQSFPELEISILWEVNTGSSWGDCSRGEIEKLRRELASAHE